MMLSNYFWIWVFREVLLRLGIIEYSFISLCIIKTWYLLRFSLEVMGWRKILVTLFELQKTNYKINLVQHFPSLCLQLFHVTVPCIADGLMGVDVQNIWSSTTMGDADLVPVFY